MANDSKKATDKAVFKVSTDDSGLRLDVSCAKLMPEMSRSAIKRYINKDYITLSRNGRNIKVSASSTVKADDIITIKHPALDVKTELNILYEDSDAVVINKPAGLLVHPKSSIFNEEETLQHILEAKYGNSLTRAGIVHRLDRYTSGVLIIAKNEHSREHLIKQFSDRQVNKLYVAIVEGELDNQPTRLQWPLSRDYKKPARYKVSKTGRPAISEILYASKGERYSAVIVKPLTGRTHQIRVHLAHLGHPVVNDTLYGAKHTKTPRYLLHSLQLEISLPSGNKKAFKAPLPLDIKHFLADNSLDIGDYI